jgi:hypothetical protein
MAHCGTAHGEFFGVITHHFRILGYRLLSCKHLAQSQCLRSRQVAAQSQVRAKLRKCFASKQYFPVAEHWARPFETGYSGHERLFSLTNKFVPASRQFVIREVLLSYFLAKTTARYCFVVTMSIGLRHEFCASHKQNQHQSNKRSPCFEIPGYQGSDNYTRI